MEFISRYVREQKRYTKRDLKSMFLFSNDDENEAFIKSLKAFGILKTVKNSPMQMELSDLFDADIEIADVTSDDNEYFYVFTYVGVITVGNRVIKCYPKYLALAVDPTVEMIQVLKVLSSYGSAQQIINLYNGDGEINSFNLLAVILFLLNDYHESGLYANFEDIVETNGDGPILWSKTIDDGFAMIINNRPYYVDTFTHRSVDDEQDYFLRLHKCILTECSKQLEASDLLALFDMATVNLSEEGLTDFGDDNYILYRIQSELNVQFNTRKQLLLKTLYAYIAQHRTLKDSYGISMYGTTSFNLVWESVCAEVLGNKLQMQLCHLPLPVGLDKRYNPNAKLIDIIDKPIWSGIQSSGLSFNKEAPETLIPDLINIYQNGKDYQFTIFDAKYYCLQLEYGKPLRGQPGVSDVTKQYLYQLAFKDFLDAHKISKVKNCFLLPTEKNTIIKTGAVSMEMFWTLGLQQIQIRLLPAKTMYELYLGCRNLDTALLDL